MGHFSDLAIEISEGRRVWSGAILSVCAGCFEDPALKAVIANAADEPKCAFCGEESTDGSDIAAPLDEVAGHISASLFREWTNADSELPHDDEGDGYLLEPTWTSDELLWEIELELPRDHTDALRREIVSCLPEIAWCRQNPLMARPHEAIANSWRTFCHVIKHQRRFYFLSYDPPELAEDIDQMEAAYTIPELLDEVSAYALRAGMFVTMPKGTRYVRAMSRDDPDAPPYGPRRMGPPPFEFARQANRMSPAGVPMFYGAADDETALCESTREPATFAVGTFETRRDLILLDLRHPPAIPSLFDAARADDRPFARFMDEFIGDFQKPITTGGEVDYVPTQVVTEYFRSVTQVDGQPVDGILYTSTRHAGGEAVVLFADTLAVEDVAADDAFNAPKSWLRMVDYREVHFDPGTTN